MPVLTTADGGRGRAGNQFLPGPRLVPAARASPNAKKETLKNSCPMVWLCSHAQGMFSVHWRGDFPLHTPLSLQADLSEPCKGSPACLKSLFSSPGSPVLLSFVSSPLVLYLLLAESGARAFWA